MPRISNENLDIINLSARKPEIITIVTTSGFEMRKRLGKTLDEPCSNCGQSVDAFSCLTEVCANCAY